MKNKFTTVEFLFNKLTYKSSSYASTRCIHPSLLMSAWLTTIVFSVSALFCRKISEKVYLSMKTVNSQKKGRAWRWTFLRVSKQVKACGFNWRVFHHANFSNLANVFASVIVFPLKHIIRVSFAFWHQKWQNYCDESLFLFWMAHGTHQLSDDCLFVQSSCWIFWTERLDWQNMIFYNHLLLYNKQKKIRHVHFTENCLNFK